MTILCLLIVAAGFTQVTALGSEKPFALDVSEFQVGKKWDRMSVFEQKVAGPFTASPVLVHYMVVEGYSEKGPNERIVVEVDNPRILGGNSPFRIVMGKNGLFRALLVKRGETWIEWDKANTENQEYPQIFILHHVLMHYLFLPFPINWESAIDEVTTDQHRKAIIVKAVRGDELTVTCAVRLQQGEAENADPPIKKPEHGQAVNEVITAKFRKGEPWAISLESTWGPQCNLSMGVEQAKK